MDGWKLDRDEYYVSPAMTYVRVGEIASDFKEAGVEYWTSYPPSGPDGPVMFIPINALIGQARNLSGERP